LAFLLKLDFVGLDALQIPVASSQWSVVSIGYDRLIRSQIAGHWPLVTGHLLSDKLQFAPYYKMFQKEESL
jgi:hypothetical protein